MTPTNLRITVTTAEDEHIVALAGVLDRATVSRLRETVADICVSHGQRITLDAADIQFCDSSGLTALIALRERTQREGAHLVLTRVPAHITRMLTVFGLDSFFSADPAHDPEPG